MPSRPKILMVLTAVLAFALFGIPALSGATFTSTSTNAASTVTGAADWTPPTVSVRDPGTTVSGTATITADATDANSGIANVVIQYYSGSTWTTICTDATAPYSCAWSTTARTDGSYPLRAIATDNAGYVTTSSSVSTTVANNLTVVLGDPGDIVKGSVTLNATLLNNLLPGYSIQFQYAVSGTTTWTTLCTDSTAPFTCTWDTTKATQGESYDLRANAILVAVTAATSTTVVDVLVDNVAPSVTMTDPGTPLRGTVTLAATANDNESDLASVVIQAQRSGTGTWTTVCTILTDPFNCRYDTSQLVDGTYSFRAIATDNAANTTTSNSVASRVIDNSVSSVSMEDPGAYLAGTVSLTASASSTAGVTSVRIDRAPNGTGTWTAVCTDTTAPYSCSFTTTTVADGLYDFRAVLVDGAAKTTTSTTVAARRIDNSPLRGYNVQTANGGVKTGQMDAGDTISLTYSQTINPATVVAGWTGTSRAVVVRLRDALQVGLSGSNDTLDFLATVNGSAVNLGSINLKQNYIKNNKSVQFNATMVTSTVTINGVAATTVTITLGTVATGSGQRTQSNSSTMIWTPSALVTSPSGQATSTAPTSELGTTDREF